MVLQSSTIISMSAIFALIMLVPLYVVDAAESLQGMDLINYACNRTETPDICASNLASDHRSFHAKNLTTLCRIAIEIAAAKANATVLFISKLLSKVRDRDLKMNLLDCQDLYEISAHDVIKLGLDHFDKQRYGDAELVVLGVAMSDENCNATGVPPLIRTADLVSKFGVDASMLVRSLYK